MRLPREFRIAALSRSLGFGACFVLLAAAFSQKLVTPGYLFNSDPTCHEINGKFYLITTQDPFTTRLEVPNDFYKGMYAYRALTTEDFDHWVDHGSIITGRDVTWNTGFALWDGDAAIAANGMYYAYAPFRTTSALDQDYGTYEIGVFTAKDPLGPYKDVFGGPMKLPDGSPLVGLSPTITRALDGSPYLIWGSGETRLHEVQIARLKPDMTQLAEAPRTIEVPKQDACGNFEYFESPMLLHHGPEWYFTYVAYKNDKGPGCDAKGSYVNYIEGDNMFGPFTGSVHHLVFPAGDSEESIQQGFCSYRGQMFLAYHVPYENVAGEHDHHRQVAVTRLQFLPDGTLQPIIPGRDPGAGTPGVSELTLDAFAPRREAAEFHARMNAEAEKGLRGEYQLKMGDGGYLRFHNVAFAGGATEFQVEVSSENPSLSNGTLEVRLDHPAGELIAVAKVAYTGGPTTFRLLTVPLLAKVHGVHDLCLVAHGDSSPTQRRLFNITWFRFKPAK